MSEHQQVEWKRSWRDEYLKRPYNPDVANAFFRAGEIEAWGRGIQRIFDACREVGTPVPRIRVEPGDLWVEFPFSPAYLDSVAAMDQQPVGPEEPTLKTSVKTSVKASGKTSGKIIEMIRQDPTITIPEMAETLGKSKRAVEMQIAKLRNSGIVGRIGPARGGRWKVTEDKHE